MTSVSRRRLIRASVGLAAVGVSLASGGLRVSAIEFDEQIEQRKIELEDLTERRNETEAFLSATRARRSSLQSRLRVIEEARYHEVAKLQGLQRQLETRELDVYENTRQIQALTSDFETEKQVLAGKLRALYKANRGISGLELVLSSGSFTEALDRIASLRLVVRQDIAGIREIEEKSAEILIRTRLIEEQRREIQRLQEQRETVKGELEARSREQNDLIARVEAEAGVLESDVEAFEGEQEAISTKIADLRYQKRLELERLERQRLLEEARKRAAAASAAAAASGGGGYIWPLIGIITAEYGGCTFGQCPHLGVDIAAPLASPVVAAADGVVLHAGYAFTGDRRASYGMLVIIAHSDTEETLYAHLADITLPPPVSPGQLVSRGQIIGYVGLSGWTSGPHLHFEYRVNQRQINPRGVLG